MISPIPLSPAARHVDTFILPAVTKPAEGPTEAQQLAFALSGLSRNVSDMLPTLEEAGREDAKRQASADFERLQLKNQVDFKNAVDSGQIADGNNQWKIAHLQDLVAQRQTTDGLNNVFTDFRDSSNLYNTDDTTAAKKYLDQRIKPLVDDLDPATIVAVQPQIEAFRNGVISNLISRRTQARSEKFDAELAGSTADAALNAATGRDATAPGKLQAAYNKATLTTDPAKARAIMANAVIHGYTAAGIDSGGPTAAEALLRQIKTGTDAKGNPATLFDDPGTQIGLSAFGKRYAEDIAQNGALANHVHEQAVKAAAIPLYQKLRAAIPTGTPLDQQVIPLENLKTVSPEVYDEVQNMLIASQKNDAYIKKTAGDQANQDDASRLFMELTDGTPMVKLGPLINNMISRGGTSEARSVLDTYKDLSSTTDVSDWATVLGLHADGNWNANTLAPFLPRIGRDKIDEAFKLADPSDPVNRRDGGKLLLGRVAPDFVAELKARNAGRYAYHTELGFDVGPSVDFEHAETVSAAKQADEDAMAVQFQDRLRRYLEANPKATENDLVEQGRSIKDDIAKTLGLPTIDQISNIRVKRAEIAKNAAQAALNTPGRQETAKDSLTRIVDSVDPIMRQMTPDLKSRVDRMMAIPTASDSQLPDLYQPDHDVGFMEKVGNGLSSWATKASALADDARNLRLGIGIPLVPQQRLTQNTSAILPTPVDPTQDYLTALVSAQDPDRGSMFKGMVNGRDAALQRRDELRALIQSKDIVGNLSNLTKTIETRAQLGGNPATAISYEDKKQIRDYQNVLSEYEVLTKYAGVPVDEAVGMGADAYQHVLLFGDDLSMTPQAVQSIGKQFGLTTPEQLRGFVAAQTALLRHRDYAIRRRG